MEKMHNQIKVRHSTEDKKSLTQRIFIKPLHHQHPGARRSFIHFHSRAEYLIFKWELFLLLVRRSFFASSELFPNVLKIVFIKNKRRLVGAASINAAV